MKVYRCVNCGKHYPSWRTKSSSKECYVLMKANGKFRMMRFMRHKLIAEEA